MNVAEGAAVYFNAETVSILEANHFLLEWLKDEIKGLRKEYGKLSDIVKANCKNATMTQGDLIPSIQVAKLFLANIEQQQRLEKLKDGLTFNHAQLTHLFEKTSL